MSLLLRTPASADVRALKKCWAPRASAGAIPRDHGHVPAKSSAYDQRDLGDARRAHNAPAAGSRANRRRAIKSRARRSPSPTSSSTTKLDLLQAGRAAKIVLKTPPHVRNRRRRLRPPRSGQHHLPRAARLAAPRAGSGRHRHVTAATSFHQVRERGLVPVKRSSKSKLESLPGNLAIGHTRYSTTGGDNDRNVQPFAVQYAHGSVAVAHNWQPRQRAGAASRSSPFEKARLDLSIQLRHRGDRPPPRAAA